MTSRVKSYSYQFLLSIALLTAYIVVVQWLWDWHVLFRAWTALPLGAALVAVALVMGSYLLRAWRFYDYFRAAMTGRFALCVKLTFYHNLLNNLMPVRSGEISFPLLMSRYFGVGLLRSSSVLLWYRVMDLHTLGCLGMLAFSAHSAAHSNWWYTGFILWLPVPILLYLAHLWLARLLKNYPQQRLARLAADALDALPQTHGVLWRAWLLTWANWLIKLIALAWVLQQFLDMPYAAAWVGVMAGDLTSVLPINAPAGIGTYEAGVSAGLTSWGLAFTHGLPAAVNLHLFLLTTTLLSGAIAWFIPQSAPPQPEPPSR